MNNAILKHKVKLNTGVIGELTIGSLKLQTLETEDCLKAGKYELVEEDGRYKITDGYYLSMDSNGQYKQRSLVLGTEFSFKIFDVVGKGDAIQALFKHYDKGLTITVLPFETKYEERCTKLEAELRDLKLASAEAKSLAVDAAEKEADFHKEQISSLKSVLLWSVTQWGEKAASAEASKAVLEELNSKAVKED